MWTGSPLSHTLANCRQPLNLRTRTMKRAAVFAALALFVAGCETVPEDSPELSIEPVLEAPAPGTVNLAERAIADNRFGDAKKLLERVLISEPGNVQAILLFGELRLATGQHKSAAEVFKTLIEDPEVGTRALQGQGISLLLSGKKKPGYEALTRAVEQDSTLWRAWNALGYYHDSNRDWDKAVASYENALAEKTDSAMIYNNRGFSMMMQGRLEEALDDLNQALALDPDLELAQENMRLTLAWDGKYLRALSGANERNMGRVLNNVGFIAILRGDYTNAEAYLLRAMEEDPIFNEAASRNLAYLKHVRKINDADSQSVKN